MASWNPVLVGAQTISRKHESVWCRETRAQGKWSNTQSGGRWAAIWEASLGVTLEQRSGGQEPALWDPEEEGRPSGWGLPAGVEDSRR